MKRFIITIALLITATIANYAFSRPEAALDRQNLAHFPKIIGDWKTVGDQTIDEGSMGVLQVDDYMMRTYINNKGETIGLYIGYFKTQREGKQVHSPRQCLPGAGWNTIQHAEYMLKLKNHNPARVPINFHVMGKGQQRELYLWWYQGRGRIYANEYMNKFYLIWDAITQRRTDGALLRINMSITSSIEQALTTQIDFINLFIPLLPKYIPN
jgi:EpsI family protein